MKKKLSIILAVLLAVLLALGGCSAGPSKDPVPPDYADPASWVFRETDVTGKDADVFFLCPSAFAGRDDALVMDLTYEKGTRSFAAAVAQEKGVYDDKARFFAPYYRQAGYKTYTLEESKRQEILKPAFADVQSAFAAYMEQDNQGRPFILAGFSEGAELVLRLLATLTEEQLSRMVACYAIGWRVTQEDLAEHPQFHMAQGETDTGVIVSYNAEAPQVTETTTIPADAKTLGINPLNWRTDTTPADKSLNLGYCWVDDTGAIVEEIPNLTGAYLDPERGALKLPDIDPAVYDKTLSILGPGDFHLYDVAFFYRNLEQNVQARIAAYLSAR